MASTYSLTPPPLISHSSVKVSAPATTASVFHVNKYHRTAVSFNLLYRKPMLRSSHGASAVAADEEGTNWDLCRRALSNFNFDMEEEDKILGKAFGHIHSPYWGEERPKQVPKYETVDAILNYLRSLTLNDEDVTKILKKFPEVLGCNLDEELKKNVMILEKEWGITGKSLRNLLLRNPKVLGYNVDCKGSCVAQCTRIKRCTAEETETKTVAVGQNVPGGDWERKNRLQIYEGLYCLSHRNFKN